MCRARTLAEGSGRVQSAREQSSTCPRRATLATPRPMARIDRGELLTRTLARHGVREIFTLHGGHLDAAYQAESARRLRFIDTRHEQAAGHAADGWARTTGRVGVAMVTAGPGVTDVVTAVANAYLDCVPTLFIGGAAPLRDAETLPLQGGFDQLALMQPITKWAHRITQTARIPDLVTQALRVATTGRPGPVFLEIPIDVLFARVDEERATVPAYLRPEAAPAPAAAAVERALAWLAEAERPVIMAGGGVWFSGGAAELRAFAEQTGIPVVANSKAQGIVPGDHPLAGGGFGTLAVLGPAGNGPDVVLLLGARLGLFTGGRGGAQPCLPARARERRRGGPGGGHRRRRRRDGVVDGDGGARRRGWEVALARLPRLPRHRHAVRPRGQGRAPRPAGRVRRRRRLGRAQLRRVRHHGAPRPRDRHGGEQRRAVGNVGARPGPHLRRGPARGDRPRRHALRPRRRGLRLPRGARRGARGPRSGAPPRARRGAGR